jgi:hypothetical protein
MKTQFFLCCVIVILFTFSSSEYINFAHFSDNNCQKYSGISLGMFVENNKCFDDSTMPNNEPYKKWYVNRTHVLMTPGCNNPNCHGIDCTKGENAFELNKCVFVMVGYIKYFMTKEKPKITSTGYYQYHHRSERCHIFPQTAFGRYLVENVCISTFQIGSKRIFFDETRKMVTEIGYKSTGCQGEIVEERRTSLNFCASNGNSNIIFQK